MKTRYSKITGAFYPLDIDYGANLPADVIDVPMEAFAAAMARPAGYTFAFVDGQLILSAPPSLTLEQVKAAKLAELAESFAQRMNVIKSNYPPDEIQSWFNQKSEAVAFKADNTAPTPLLTAMAVARTISVNDLASRVIVNANAYAATAGAIIGKRQKYEDDVNAAVDAAAVALITWTD